jgi:chaperone BCS1
MDPKDAKDMGKKPDVNIQSYASQPKITLGDILNVLDGVPERHGHILVFDTNHLERLDPALIRPGRVDRIIRWDSISATSLRAYLANYYQCVVPADKKLPDRKFTAAEVGQITMAHKTLAGCLRALSKK